MVGLPLTGGTAGSERLNMWGKLKVEKLLRKTSKRRPRLRPQGLHCEAPKTRGRRTLRRHVISERCSLTVTPTTRPWTRASGGSPTFWTILGIFHFFSSWDLNPALHKRWDYSLVYKGQQVKGKHCQFCQGAEGRHQGNVAACSELDTDMEKL